MQLVALSQLDRLRQELIAAARSGLLHSTNSKVQLPLCPVSMPASQSIAQASLTATRDHQQRCMWSAGCCEGGAPVCRARRSRQRARAGALHKQHVAGRLAAQRVAHPSLRCRGLHGQASLVSIHAATAGLAELDACDVLDRGPWHIPADLCRTEDASPAFTPREATPEPSPSPEPVLPPRQVCCATAHLTHVLPISWLRRTVRSCRPWCSVRGRTGRGSPTTTGSSASMQLWAGQLTPGCHLSS